MTVNTIRPDGTSSAGSATFTGGVTWQAVTSDDSDASYATQPVGDGGAFLHNSTFTLPAGNVVKQVRVRMRVRADSGTSVVKVRDNTTQAVVQATATTTITTYTGAYLPFTLTQADIDSTRMLVETLSGASSRVVELYTDVMHASQPTVNIYAPTGTQITSLTMVSWTYTQGSDGGPQSRYRVKVFTAATIAGGGFNPETSASVYDSGEVVSSATDHIVGPFVTDMVNCGAYVKAAQTINGSPHWSAWDSQTFTVDITTPDVTSVVPSPINGAISVVVNRNTGGPAWTAVTVERSRDSGTTWEFVRGATQAAASGNTFTVVDYEAPHSTNVLYRAQAHDATTYSSYVQAASQVQWTHTDAWLKDLTTPGSNRPVELRATPDVASADTRTVSLTVKTDTAAEADALETLLGPPRRVGVFHVLGADLPVVVTDNGSVMLFQAPTAWSLGERWLVMQRYTKQHLDTRLAANTRRIYQLEMVEVERPPDTSS